MCPARYASHQVIERENEMSYSVETAPVKVRVKIRKIIGAWLKVISIILYIGWGLWTLFAEAVIVNEVAGFWGIVIGITVAPITFFAAPIYTVVEWGEWFPVISIFGGGILISIIYGVACLLRGED